MKYEKNKKFTDLTVITKSKDLSKYIFETTQNSPKKFRFSLISKVQKISLDITEGLNNANDTFIDLKLLKDLDKSIVASEKELIKVKDNFEKQHLENKILTLKLTRASKFEERIMKRIDGQYKTMNQLKELDHLIVVSREMHCISYKQQEHIANLISEIRRMLYKWIESDKKRYKY